MFLLQGERGRAGLRLWEVAPQTGGGDTETAGKAGASSGNECHRQMADIPDLEPKR